MRRVHVPDHRVRIDAAQGLILSQVPFSFNRVTLPA